MFDRLCWAPIEHAGCIETERFRCLMIDRVHRTEMTFQNDYIQLLNRLTYTVVLSDRGLDISRPKDMDRKKDRNNRRITYDFYSH